MAGTLLLAITGLFALRRRHERPQLMPYLVVAHIAIVGGWLGNHGGGLAAVALLTAASFLTLHVASQPYPETPEERG